MVSTTYSLAQLFALVIPGMIVFIATKQYFPVAKELWNSLVSTQDGFSVLIPTLFISMAVGVVIQGATFGLSRLWLQKRVPIRYAKINAKANGDADAANKSDGAMVDFGRLIKQLEAGQLGTIRGVYHFHQTMMNMTFALGCGLVSLTFDPEIPAETCWWGVDARIWVVTTFLGLTILGAYSTMSAFVDVSIAVDRHLVKAGEKRRIGLWAARAARRRGGS
jgi:hypothetical protein